MIDQANLNQQNEFTNPSPVPPPIVPTPPTVILPSINSSVPKWFYFIFGITIIVFFLVTTLFVMQLTQKQQISNIEAVPTVIPRVIQSVVISPVLSPAASDAAILKLNTMDISDEINSIEADLKNTDLTVLDKGIEESDREMNEGAF